MISHLSVLRMLARITSILSIVIMLVFMIGEKIPVSTLTQNNVILMLFFPVGVIMGMIISWFKEGTGALFTFFCRGIFYALNFYFSSKFPDGPYFLFFTIPAFIFLLHWYASFTSAFNKIKT